MPTPTTAFSQRNISYLRVSPRIVLQAILYLDQRHLAWFNEPLQNLDPDLEAERGAPRFNGDLLMKRVLRVLRKNIMDKLVREAPSSDPSQLGVMSKKERVDVHLDEDFQMAYFFKKVSHRHAVLLKEKQFTFDHLRSTRAAAQGVREPSSVAEPTAAATLMGIDDDADALAMPPPPSKRPRVDNAPSSSSTTLDFHPSSDGTALKPDPDSLLPTAPLDSLAPLNSIKPDPALLEEEQAAATSSFDLDFNAGLENTIRENPPGSSQELALDLDAADEEGEDEKKPRLKVKYSGFRIFAKQLIIVIEPTRSLRRRRPELFSIQGGEEMSRLSTVPGQVGSTPAPGAGTPQGLGTRTTPGFARGSVGVGVGTEGGGGERSRLSATPTPGVEDVGSWRGSSTPAPPGVSSNALFRGPTPGAGGGAEREPTPLLASQRDGAASRMLGRLLERERNGRSTVSQSPALEAGAKGGETSDTPVRDVGLSDDEEDEEDGSGVGARRTAPPPPSGTGIGDGGGDGEGGGGVGAASTFAPTSSLTDQELEGEFEEGDDEEYQRAEELALQMLEQQDAAGDAEKEVDGP